MRSPLVAHLLLIGCALFPEAAFGRLVPIYVWRAAPTSSPTETPSYQPSSRPTSEPSSHPSVAPSISMQPSQQPTSSPSYSPSYQPTLSAQPSTSTPLLRASNLANPEPQSFGFVLVISLVSVLLCFVCVGFRYVRKSKRDEYDDDDESFEDNEDDESVTTSDNSQNSNQRRSNIDQAHVTDGLLTSLHTRFQRAIDSLTTQNRHVHFANKKQVQVYHITEEPGMVTHDDSEAAARPPTPTPILRPPTPTNLPSTPVPRRPPTPILRSSTPTPILR